jgi:hypothetical protein
MTALRSLRGALALAVLALVAGCASVPSKSLTDGRVITMTPDFGGWYVYVTPLK